MLLIDCSRDLYEIFKCCEENKYLRVATSCIFCSDNDVFCENGNVGCLAVINLSIGGGLEQSACVCCVCVCVCVCVCYLVTLMENASFCFFLNQLLERM